MPMRPSRFKSSNETVLAGGGVRDDVGADDGLDVGEPCETVGRFADTWDGGLAVVGAAGLAVGRAATTGTGRTGTSSML